MRFHVIGLAHTQTTVEYTSCAYTQKVRNFCRMMHKRGHEVYLYSGDQNDAPCTEHIPCITESQRADSCKGKHFHHAPHDPKAAHWITFNGNAIEALGSRARKGDFLCIIFGFAQKPIADAVRILKPVEYGIGYHATFAQHRVFESYAWMHSVYAADKRTSDRDGIWFDGVVSPYIDPDQFALAEKKRDYLFYMGRMIDRKGVKIAVEIAQATGRRLIGAGPGTAPKGMHHIGEIGVEKRARTLARAHAVLMPTVYIEPGGNVAIEAMASGTPVITTDWGVFTETVVEGVTGFRCRTLQEFVDAVNNAGSLDPHTMRQYAVNRFGLDVIGAEYERYFKRLSTLWGKGWYELRKEEQANVA